MPIRPELRHLYRGKAYRERKDAARPLLADIASEFDRAFEDAAQVPARGDGEPLHPEPDRVRDRRSPWPGLRRPVASQPVRSGNGGGVRKQKRKQRGQRQVRRYRDGFVRCRVCSCTEREPCAPSCSWVDGDLCSGCAVVVEAVVHWMDDAHRPSWAALRREVHGTIARESICVRGSARR